MDTQTNTQTCTQSVTQSPRNACMCAHAQTRHKHTHTHAHTHTHLSMHTFPFVDVATRPWIISGCSGQSPTIPDIHQLMGGLAHFKNRDPPSGEQG
mmetsp:Transcript_138955/g.241622  ORF Transcript_138955/g.241622 Transcript_138955/m.241622 type:complete len:96 (-) Transcript_138955:1316-1603(-)